MAHPVLPNASDLIAVALVINRSRDGPSLVFHYPPKVGRDGSASPGSSNSDDVFNHDDIILERLLTNPIENHAPNRAYPPRGYQDDHLFTEAGTQIVPWEFVAGFPTRDLAHMLTPGKTYHKKLFQLSLDTLLCVSCPVHVPDSGIWKKKKKPSRLRSHDTGDSLLTPAEADGRAKGVSDQLLSAREDVSESKVVAEDDDENERQKDKEKEEKISTMTMFNVVFMLTRRRHEGRQLVNALYANIMKQVNKAFRYSQQHSDLIWKGSKGILAMKDRGREDRTPMGELWTHILKAQPLAVAIKDIYESLSQNRIVSLQLDTTNGPLNLSMQIPVPFYVSDLPLEGDESQHGLWLTTANTYIPDEALEDPEYLDKTFALLLMDSEKKIISQLQADPDAAASPMIEFVRLCKPTASLHQIGQATVLSHAQVRKYAQHFISWRRAIAIPPLHGRDVYVVSPNCDLSRLPQAAQRWQRAFPLAPPLTNFLPELSYRPRAWKTFCPSKVHRPSYFEMLAWLIRGGWVTQLCTFAYVVVWPEIIYEVEYEMEAEELQRRKDAESEGSKTPSRDRRHHSLSSPSEPPPQGDSSASANYSGTSSSPATASQQMAEKALLERMATKIQREAAEKATAHARKILPAKTEHPSTNDAVHLASLTPYVILDAKKASGEDSRYLAAIEKRLREGEDGEKIAGAWQRFWKYFDGHSALERVALLEDMKRKETWNLFMAVSEYLLCVRHW